MIPPMLRHCALFAVVLGCLAACQQRVTTTPEEQHLLERLARDPSMKIAALDRDDDRHLVVTTVQGNVTARYVFSPDVAGEKTLNIHRLGDASHLAEGAGERPAPLRQR